MPYLACVVFDRPEVDYIIRARLACLYERDPLVDDLVLREPVVQELLRGLL